MTRWPFTAKIDQPAPSPDEHPGWDRRFVDDNPRGTEEARFLVLDRRVPRHTIRRSQHPKSVTENFSVTEKGTVSPVQDTGSSSPWGAPVRPRPRVASSPSQKPSSQPRIEFSELPSVAAMVSGRAVPMVGFDTEFSTVDGERVIASYQFCVVDPQDSSVMVQIVILPLSGRRIRLSTALYEVWRSARLCSVNFSSARRTPKNRHCGHENRHSGHATMSTEPPLTSSASASHGTNCR